MAHALAFFAGALCTVLMSSAASSWGSWDTSLAKISALSLPSRSQWEGNHCRWNRRVSETSLERWSHTAAPSSELWAGGPAHSDASADWLSVQTTIGSSSFTLSTSQRRDASRATISALKLEPSLPAGGAYLVLFTFRTDHQRTRSTIGDPSIHRSSRRSVAPNLGRALWEGGEVLLRRSLPRPRGRSDR